jgi:hypothetical protein
MDEKKEPRTTLKIPFAGRTVRMLALDASQLVGMSMMNPNQLTSMSRPGEGDDRPLPVMYEVMRRQCLDGEWDAIVTDWVTGVVPIADVVALFGELITRSGALVKAKSEPQVLDLPAADPYDAMSHGLSVSADA